MDDEASRRYQNLIAICQTGGLVFKKKWIASTLYKFSSEHTLKTKDWEDIGIIEANSHKLFHPLMNILSCWETNILYIDDVDNFLRKAKEKSS